VQTATVQLLAGGEENSADGRFRYKILGPLRVQGQDTGAIINSRKIQTTLALLLIRAGRVVTTDELCAEIWGNELPRRAVACLHVYISQLRKFLSYPDRDGSPIVTRRPSGYSLQVAPDELDLNTFRRLAHSGRSHLRNGCAEEARKALDSTLRLWRGAALDGLWNSPAISAFAACLEEERLECIEMFIESALCLGQERDLISSLYALTNEYPLREAFHRQLMLALYRAERRGEALGAYRTAARTLRLELGLDPGRALRELQQRILLDDASSS
jgi:DNA-binding SARP family transcriptional activator